MSEKDAPEPKVPMPGEIWVAKSGTGSRRYVIGKSINGLIVSEILLEHGKSSGLLMAYLLKDWFKSFRFESGGCDQ